MLAKNKVLGPFGVAAALASLSSAIAGAPNLKLEPGKYVLTITYEVQDQRRNEPRTTTRCITRGDLDDPERIFNDPGRCTGGKHQGVFGEEFEEHESASVRRRMKCCVFNSLVS